MKLDYYKINPTGNISLIVETPVPRESQAAVAAALMAMDKDAEQVGFLEKTESKNCLLRLQMMGGEFCGNASISVAALVLYLGKAEQGKKMAVNLEVSGSDEPVKVEACACGGNRYTGTLNMPLPYSNFECEFKCGNTIRKLPVVRFPGIAHAIVRSGIGKDEAESCIREWCRQLDSESLGLMFYDEKKGLLQPYVYVAPTDSAVWESSCASGSTAVAAWAALNRGESSSLSLRQPGGTLSAAAEIMHGTVQKLMLTGSAEVMGKFSVTVN